MNPRDNTESGRDTRRANARARKRRQQPFPRIYANAKEDFELYETDEDQIKAVMVDLDITNFSF